LIEHPETHHLLRRVAAPVPASGELLMADPQHQA